MEFGKRIKKRRQELGMSLRELAGKAGLTASFLSQVERDLTSPSIESLRKISQALDVPTLYFLLESDQPKPVVRHSERRKITLPSDISYELLTPDVNRKMEMLLAELDSREGEIPLTHYHHTEEFIFALSGKPEIRVDCETYELEKGDAIYFEGATLQRIAARGEQTVRYLSVITPPIF